MPIFRVAPNFSHLLPNITVLTKHPSRGVSGISRVRARASRVEAARLHSPGQLDHVGCLRTVAGFLHALYHELRARFCAPRSCQKEYDQEGVPPCLIVRVQKCSDGPQAAHVTQLTRTNAIRSQVIWISTHWYKNMLHLKHVQSSLEGVRGAPSSSASSAARRATAAARRVQVGRG